MTQLLPTHFALNGKLLFNRMLKTHLKAGAFWSILHTLFIYRPCASRTFRPFVLIAMTQKAINSYGRSPLLQCTTLTHVFHRFWVMLWKVHFHMTLSTPHLSRFFLSFSLDGSTSSSNLSYHKTLFFCWVQVDAPNSTESEPYIKAEIQELFIFWYQNGSSTA